VAYFYVAGFTFAVIVRFELGSGEGGEKGNIPGVGTFTVALYEYLKGFEYHDGMASISLSSLLSVLLRAVLLITPSGGSCPRSAASDCNRVRSRCGGRVVVPPERRSPLQCRPMLRPMTRPPDPREHIAGRG